MKNGMAECRHWPRLNLKLNVEFRLENGDQGASRMGTTANVCAGGAYFLTREWGELRPGQDVSLRLSGLSGFGTGFPFRSLCAKAIILRLDAPSQPSARAREAGVAVRFSERPRFEAYPQVG